MELQLACPPSRASLLQQYGVIPLPHSLAWLTTDPGRLVEVAGPPASVDTGTVVPGTLVVAGILVVSGTLVVAGTLVVSDTLVVPGTLVIAGILVVSGTLVVALLAALLGAAPTAILPTHCSAL